MLKLNDLEEWLEDLKKIIFDTKVSLDNIKRMTDTPDEYEKQILSDGFFLHFYLQSRFTIIIQLCKIFDEKDNQKRNLFKLFNRLNSEKYDNKLSELLRNNFVVQHLFSDKAEIIKEIESLREEIESHKELIKRLVNLRDKFYAHSDPHANLPKIIDAELEILINLAIKIYNKINGSIFNETFMFDMNEDWSIDTIIKILSKQRKERLMTNHNTAQ